MDISYLINLFELAPFSYSYQQIKKNYNGQYEFIYFYHNKNFTKLTDIQPNLNIETNEDIYNKFLNINIDWEKIKKNNFEGEFYSYTVDSLFKLRIISHINDFYSVYLEKISDSNKCMENVYIDIIKTTHEGIAIIQDNKFVFFNKAVKNIF